MDILLAAELGFSSCCDHLKGGSVQIASGMSREQLAVQRARRSFQTGRTRPLDFRTQQLRRLQSFIKERHRDIKDALQRDLGKGHRWDGG
ncbi:hypothetical protein ILYODFUR_031382 [Ilyodon furcidens]|uniref:Uncharacterized protein n=1 Tax=Ilyodon furcidens TaxID=33524 RepID=A0ABV0VIQ2_9TELE